MTAPAPKGTRLVNGCMSPLPGSALSSLLCLLEIPQIGRRLIPLGRHQRALRAQHVGFLADDNLLSGFGARDAAPVWIGIRVALERLVDAPGPGKGMIEGGDFISRRVGSFLSRWNRS